MALHILKLCVGCDSVEDLEAWIARRVEERKRAGQAPTHSHVTRMVPRRTEELEGGSLFWVIKGAVQCRQKLVGIEPFTDGEGIGRCRLLLDPGLVRTQWQPRRPFQGWRYLRDEDKAADLASGGDEAMPANLQRELAELGLL